MNGVNLTVADFPWSVSCLCCPLRFLKRWGHWWVSELRGSSFPAHLETELAQCCADSLAIFCNPGSESVLYEMSEFAGKISLSLGGESQVHF